jgi:hypothetical protein
MRVVLAPCPQTRSRVQERLRASGGGERGGGPGGQLPPSPPEEEARGRGSEAAGVLVGEGEHGEAGPQDDRGLPECKCSLLCCASPRLCMCVCVCVRSQLFKNSLLSC